MADEISKALELANTYGPYALAILNPVGKKVLGMIEGEIDVYWGTWQKHRKERFEQRFKGTLDMLEESGRAEDAKQVTPKFLQQWAEGASMDDDEYMQMMWSSLLANASLDESNAVRVSFISIMNEMSPDEAKLLRWIHNRRLSFIVEAFKKTPSWRSAASDFTVSQADLGREFGGEKESIPNSIWISLEGLQSYRLVTTKPDILLDHATVNEDGGAQAVVDAQVVEARYSLSSRGLAFIEACQPPKKQEPKP